MPCKRTYEKADGQGINWSRGSANRVSDRSEHPGHTRNSWSSAVKSLIEAENGHKAQETLPGRGCTFGKYTHGKVVHVTSYQGTVAKTTVRNCTRLSGRQKQKVVRTPNAGEDADRFPGTSLPPKTTQPLGDRVALSHKAQYTTPALTPETWNPAFTPKPAHQCSQPPRGSEPPPGNYPDSL